MAKPPRVLLVEDSPSLALVYREYLSDEPIDVVHVDTGAKAIENIQHNPPSVVLLDLRLPDMNGMDILHWIHQEEIPATVIIITAHGSVDLAVDAMREGVYDFIEKPFDAKRLRVTVANALERRRLKNLVDDFQDSFERERYHGFIGSSLPMQAVYRIIDAAAPSKATVFITGESGTGKEVCAEAIHRQGPRRNGPFITINCAAIPKDLMESEIFGHTKGSFTGATGDRKGAAALADGGTLFLDEICEMDLDLQTKLLRFVQTGTFQAVGGNKLESVDIRFICATHRDPEEEVKEGRFREDLYYRLHVVPVHLPPLRERGDDIVAIANQFLRQYAEEEVKSFKYLRPEVDVIFRRYHWPGNVRQLQNVIRNIVVLHDAEEVDIPHLPPPLDTSLKQQEVVELAVVRERMQQSQMLLENHPEGATNSDEIRPLWQVEREAIEHAIAFCDGNIPRAAGLLEVSPSTIYRKKQSWETADSDVG